MTELNLLDRTSSKWLSLIINYPDEYDDTTLTRLAETIAYKKDGAVPSQIDNYIRSDKKPNLAINIYKKLTKSYQDYFEEIKAHLQKIIAAVKALKKLYKDVIPPILTRKDLAKINRLESELALAQQKAKAKNSYPEQKRLCTQILILKYGKESGSILAQKELEIRLLRSSIPKPPIEELASFAKMVKQMGGTYPTIKQQEKDHAHISESCPDSGEKSEIEASETEVDKRTATKPTL